MATTTKSAQDDYFRYPTGSPEHYEAYKKAFAREGGTGFPVPDAPVLVGVLDDPRASYEADNAYELAWVALEDEDAGWSCLSRPPDLRPYPEQPPPVPEDWEAEPW